MPVNPNVTDLQGEPCYPNLAAIPHPVELVDIFRRSEEGLLVIDEAIQIGAKVVWMQLGVINQAAGNRAEEAGLDVVMGMCTAIKNRNLAKAEKLQQRSIKRRQKGLAKRQPST